MNPALCGFRESGPRSRRGAGVGWRIPPSLAFVSLEFSKGEGGGA